MISRSVINLTANRIVGAAVFLIALISFAATVSPTESFWDCGEFIAAAFTVGVPHPPGTPLYMMIGRLFSMLPIATDIGLRVNLLSVLSSAFTSLLLYLTIVRMARAWRGIEVTVTDNMMVYGAGLIGALALTFSHSFWFNAVEAGVYGMSLTFTALVYYLALRWIDAADTVTGNRILLLIFYLTGLASGVHLLNVLALLPITYIVAFKHFDVTPKSFLLTGIIGCAVVFAIYPGVVQGVPTLITKISVFGVGAILLAMVWGAYYFVKSDKRWQAIGMISILLVILGYSTFLIIKIRSGQDPFFDENNPETWQALLSYLNREQYGTESLFMTMFQRKAPFWEYQVKQMYIRYLGWQFFDIARFAAIPFLLGIFGFVHHFYRDKKGAFVNLVLFLLTGFGILLYLNQDDPQPRERDYAYVGSYFAFAIWIGLGALSLAELAVEAIKKINGKIVSGGVLALLTAIVPMNMAVQNWHDHNRSGNYVAWDYSYNLLNSCDENGILYTNGDNDTFPLWYLQVVDGVRTDVRVINLSLLNTGWFIKQIRDKYPKVPLPPKVTDAYIENTVDSREMSGLMDRVWSASRKVAVEGPTAMSPKLVWDVPGPLAYPVGPNGEQKYFLRVQDLMILNTIAMNAAAAWERPIYFAVTVSDGNLVGLRNIRDASKNFLTMEGLTFRLKSEASELLDPDKVAVNMMRKYKYRGVEDPDIYFDDNILKLLGNYRQGLIQLAYHYLTQAEQMGDKDTTGASSDLQRRIDNFENLPRKVKALTALEFMDKTIPEERVPIKYDVLSLQIGRIYADLGKPEELSRRLDRITKSQPLTAQSAYEYGAYYLSDAQDPQSCRELFDKSIELNSDVENVTRVAYTWVQLGGDTGYAADIFRAALARNGMRPSKLKIAAEALQMGMVEFSGSIYDQLWQLDKGDAQALNGLIESLKKSGDIRKAVALTEEWLSTNPTDPGMQKKLVELKSMSGGL